MFTGSVDRIICILHLFTLEYKQSMVSLGKNLAYIKLKGYSKGEVSLEGSGISPGNCPLCHQCLAIGAADQLSQPFTKPPLFRRNRLTGSGNPTFESKVEGKAM